MSRLPVITLPICYNFSELQREEYEGVTQTEKADLGEGTVKVLLSHTRTDKEKMMVLAETLIIAGFSFTRDEIAKSLGINPRNYYKVKERFRQRNNSKLGDML